MIPKKIHLCWFSDAPFPAEIKACLDSWRRHMPGYEIRRWTMDDAKAIGFDFIDEALRHRKWAFAADAVRFHAVFTEGGIYMDSDIMLYRSFEDLLPERGFATFCENTDGDGAPFALQAAFFMGEKGNAYCGEMAEYYRTRHFEKPDGTLDQTVSPVIMASVAEKYGVRYSSGTLRLGDFTLYPTDYVAPRKRYPRRDVTFARHLVSHSWKDNRKTGRRIERYLKHKYHELKYFLFRKY